MQSQASATNQPPRGSSKTLPGKTPSKLATTNLPPRGSSNMLGTQKLKGSTKLSLASPKVRNAEKKLSEEERARLEKRRARHAAAREAARAAECSPLRLRGFWEAKEGAGLLLQTAVTESQRDSFRSAAEEADTGKKSVPKLASTVSGSLKRQLTRKAVRPPPESSFDAATQLLDEANLAASADVAATFEAACTRLGVPVHPAARTALAHVVAAAQQQQQQQLARQGTVAASRQQLPLKGSTPERPRAASVRVEPQPLVVRNAVIDLGAMAALLLTLQAHPAAFRSLHFWRCGLDAESLRLLRDGLTRLARSKDAAISSLAVEGDAADPTVGAGGLASLVELEKIGSVSLRSCSLGLVDTAPIGRALAGASTITSLSLWSNGLDDEAAAPIIGSLRHNTALRHLNLGANRLTDTTARAILAALQGPPDGAPAETAEPPAEPDKPAEPAEPTRHFVEPPAAEGSGAANRSLTALNLSHNSIGGPGRAALEAAQELSPDLHRLDIEGNPCLTLGPTARLRAPARRAIAATWATLTTQNGGVVAPVRDALLEAFGSLPPGTATTVGVACYEKDEMDEEPAEPIKPPEPPRSGSSVAKPPGAVRKTSSGAKPAKSAKSVRKLSVTEPVESDAEREARLEAERKAKVEAERRAKLQSERLRVASLVVDAIDALLSMLEQPECMVAPLHAYGRELSYRGLPAGMPFGSFVSEFVGAMHAAFGRATGSREDFPTAEWEAACGAAAACMQEQYTLSQLAVAEQPPRVNDQLTDES